MQILGKNEQERKRKMAGQRTRGGRAVEPGHTPRGRIIHKKDPFIGLQAFEQ